MKLAIMLLKDEINRLKDVSKCYRESAGDDLDEYDLEILSTYENKIEELEKAVLWLIAGNKAMLVDVNYGGGKG